ncbi:MAG: hypothetical protein JXA62_09145 [Candidatus Aminicenantes bacterium]|nr:hypothetical protein [Candidatus Aminicenantes bacterium]
MRLFDGLQRYRSTVGNLLLVVVLVFSTPNAASITTGFFLILSGAIFRAWSSGYLTGPDDFPRTGPFSLTRNPMEFGNFLIGLGVAVGANHLSSYLIVFLYFVSFFPLKMVRKHRRQKERFGNDFLVWMRQTNAFFPRLWRMVPGEFNISSYMTNREYRVIYFSLFFIVVLVIKFIHSVKPD